MLLQSSNGDANQLNRSADFQSAVSRISNPQRTQPIPRPADWQSAIRQVGNLRYQRRVSRVPSLE
jgi:hypothetical protein